MMGGDRGPIFIGGLSHSGKTELRSVVGAHPDLALTRRTYLWDRFHGRFGDLRRPRNLARCLAAVLADEGARRLEPDGERLHREFLLGPRTYARLFGLLHEHHAERHGKRRWGEQLGFVERFADPIFEAFPQARMIHMIRDPRARLAEATSDGKGRPGRVGWETARWLRSAQLAERNRRRYPDRYRIVRFETLAEDPAATVLEVCDFVGEDVHPAMTAALASLVFDPGAAGVRGSKDAVAGEVAFVDRYARRELPQFGYPSATATLSRREQLSFALVERPVNLATMTAWRLLGRASRRVGA